MCPQLAILLKLRYNILSVGTCRTNRKGWPRELLHMKKILRKKVTILLLMTISTKSHACNGVIARS